jgi:histidyl-tRNA synthetase
MSITAIKGFNDLLPAESGLWQFIEQTARQVFARYGFNEIRVPIVEKTNCSVAQLVIPLILLKRDVHLYRQRGQQPDPASGRHSQRDAGTD